MANMSSTIENEKTVQQKPNYILPLATMFLLFFVVAFVTGLNNPFGKVIQQEYNLSNAESQLSNFAFFISYLVMGIPSSLVVKRVGYQKAGIISLVVAFAGISLMLLGGLNAMIPVYLGGVFVLGAAVTILQVVVNPFISALGDSSTATQRLNFGGAVNSLGATLAPIVGGMIIGNKAADAIKLADAAPLMYTIMGILAFAIIVLAAVKLPHIAISEDSEEAKDDKYSAFSFRHLKLGALAIFFYVGVEVAIANILFLYLTTAPEAAIPGLGMDGATAGAIVGTYWFLMLVGRFVGGMIGSKVSGKTMLTVVTTAAIGLVLMGMFLPASFVNMPAINSDLNVLFAEVPVGVLCFVLAGLCTSVMWPCIFNLGIDGLGKYTNQGSGMMITMVFGGAIIPAAQGLLADASNFQMSYVVSIACLAYILFYALIGSKNVNKNIPVA